MSETSIEQVILERRPIGNIEPGDFEFRSIPLRELCDDEVLVELDWLSIDPYMRIRMGKNVYGMEPVPLGSVMVGETAGRVIASKSAEFSVGDTVCCQSGWQTFFQGNPNKVGMYKVDASIAPLHAYLGVLGMPGKTAYFGLVSIGKPQPGDTLVVSAASGAVGSVVGQIGRILGCRVIGIAGGEDHCEYVVDQLGFDVAIDYKDGKLKQELAYQCPDGIDIYFENVGGAVLDAVIPLMNPGCRVPICGYISSYNVADISKVKTPMSILSALSDPPYFQEFLVGQFSAQFPEAEKALARWLLEGKLFGDDHIIDGFENAPAALKQLFSGSHIGKQLVKIEHT